MDTASLSSTWQREQLRRLIQKSEMIRLCFTGGKLLKQQERRWQLQTLLLRPSLHSNRHFVARAAQVIQVH